MITSQLAFRNEALLLKYIELYKSFYSSRIMWREISCSCLRMIADQTDGRQHPGILWDWAELFTAYLIKLQNSNFQNVTSSLQRINNAFEMTSDSHT